MRTAAWLFGQSGDRRPVQPGVADRVEVELVGRDLQVGCAGLAVEVQREVVRREDLAERHRRRVLVVRCDVAVVDAETVEFGADEPAERVVADAGDQCGAVAESGGGDRDVGGAAAEELAERLDVLEADADLQRVDVDATAPDGEYVEGLCWWSSQLSQGGRWWTCYDCALRHCRLSIVCPDILTFNHVGVRLQLLFDLVELEIGVDCAAGG